MGRPVFVRFLTRITMAPSFSIPTATILKPYVTTLSNRLNPFNTDFR